MKLLQLKGSWDAHVLHADGDITLFSYETPVAHIHAGEVIVADGYEKYSCTTSKHINEFRRQYT